MNTGHEARVGHAADDNSLAVTIGKNTIFGMISKVSQVGTRIVTIPIVIAHLGLGGYGIWAIVMTVAAYMRFGSTGIKAAFQKYVAEATGNGEYERASTLLSTGSAAMLVLSIAGLIPICLFSKELATAVGVPAQFLASAAGAISMLALIMLFSNAGAAFEAIVMGGHRVDLARKFSTIFTVAEVVAIITVLHEGFGLFAMATVMGLSEIGFVTCCFFASRRVVPQIQIRWRHLRRSVLPELLRYGGSYQLINVLQVIYHAIVPIALLRAFGAETAGIYALAVRLQYSVMMLLDAFLVPILSSGSKVFSSGSARDIERLLRKSFKVTFALTLLPLGFIAAFGPTIIDVWTGQVNPSFQIVLWLVCLGGLFASFSILGQVLYRVSGHALLDTLRQVVRLAILFPIALFAAKLGFYGVLTGLAAAELVAMGVMLFGLRNALVGFHAESLLPDAWKLMLASGITLSAGVLAARIPLPFIASGHSFETFRLCLICIACSITLWPALTLTKSISGNESRAFLSIFAPRRLPTPSISEAVK